MKSYNVDLIHYKDEVQCYTIGINPSVNSYGSNKSEAIINIAKKLKTKPERIKVVTVSIEK
jgi:hypothetical protein